MAQSANENIRSLVMNTPGVTEIHSYEITDSALRKLTKCFPGCNFNDDVTVSRILENMRTNSVDRLIITSSEFDQLIEGISGCYQGDTDTLSQEIDYDTLLQEAEAKREEISELMSNDGRGFNLASDFRMYIGTLKSSDDPYRKEKSEFLFNIFLVLVGSRITSLLEFTNINSTEVVEQYKEFLRVLGVKHDFTIIKTGYADRYWVVPGFNPIVRDLGIASTSAESEDLIGKLLGFTCWGQMSGTFIVSYSAEFKVFNRNIIIDFYTERCNEDTPEVRADLERKKALFQKGASYMDANIILNTHIIMLMDDVVDFLKTGHEITPTIKQQAFSYLSNDGFVSDALLEDYMDNIQKYRHYIAFLLELHYILFSFWKENADGNPMTNDEFIIYENNSYGFSNEMDERLDKTDNQSIFPELDDFIEIVIKWFNPFYTETLGVELDVEQMEVLWYSY
jgi:hypothetical protein